MKIFSIEFWKKIFGLQSKKALPTDIKSSEKGSPAIPDQKKEQLSAVIENLQEQPKAANENQKPMSENKKNLYALVVGINDYQYVSKLGGCVNDAKRVEAYLKETTQGGNFEYHPVLLTDAEATKDKITYYFETHLTKAKEGDVAVFYFSGHGAQEVADEVWNISESDGALETMVCYDSRDENGTPDLADKELRYLISKVAQNNPHILVVSDSCHSGDNTRPSELVKRRLPNPEEISGDMPEEAKSRLSALSPMRTWDKFCFANKIPKEAIKNANALQEVIPEGKHVQIAACKDHELAYELRGSGVFTSMFLEVLKRSEGNISYLNLHSRLKNVVSGRYPQSPQIYASSRDANDLKATFLGGASNAKPTFYNVQRNLKSSIGWTVDVGAVHGMPSNTDEVTINILDPQDESKVLVTASVREVLPGYSKILIEGDLDDQQTYYATIDGLFVNPINVFIHGEAKGVKALQDYISKNSDDFKRSNLNLVEELVLADYLVYAKGTSSENYYIGKPMNDLSKIDTYYNVKFPGESDDSAVPYWKHLVERVPDFTPGGAKMVTDYLKHMARWEFLKRLDNPTSTITSSPMEVKIFEVKVGSSNQIISKKQLDVDEDGVIVLNYDKAYRPNQVAHLTVEVENTSTRDFFVALPVLFMGYDVYTDLLPGGSTEIKKGKTVKGHQGMPLQLRQDDPVKGANGQVSSWTDWIKDFNYPYKSVYFKLVASTLEFEISSFAQSELPPPQSHRGETARGFTNVAIPTKVEVDDWFAKTYELRLPNPFYVKPPEEFA